MLIDFNSEPRFDIISSFAAYMTLFIKFLKFWFLVPIVISKFQMAVRSFFKCEIFDVRFGIRVPKDMKMSVVAIALPKKMVITTHPSAHVRAPFPYVGSVWKDCAEICCVGRDIPALCVLRQSWVGYQYLHGPNVKIHGSILPEYGVLLDPLLSYQ